MYKPSPITGAVLIVALCGAAFVYHARATRAREATEHQELPALPRDSAKPQPALSYPVPTTPIESPASAVPSVQRRTVLQSDSHRNPTVPGKSAETDAPPISEAETVALQQQQEAQLLAVVASTFEAQPVDYAWSAATARRLNAELQGARFSNSAIETIECRTSACKLEMRLGDGRDLEVFKSDFRLKIADAFGSGMIKRDEAGRTVVFLGKDPQSLGLGPPP